MTRVVVAKHPRRRIVLNKNNNAIIAIDWEKPLYHPKYSSAEKLIDEFMGRAGALKPIDLYPKSVKIDGNDPKNADYVFQDHNVIIELKSLIESDTKFVPSTTREQYFKWKGREPKDKKFDVEICHPDNAVPNSEFLPNEYFEELKREWDKRMKRYMHQANKQIKTTKEILDMPNAHGILMFALDGNFDMDLYKLLAALEISCSNKMQNRSIDSILVFSAYPMFDPNGDELSAIIPFADFKRDRDAEDAPEIAKEAYIRMYRAMMSVLGEILIDSPIGKIDISSGDKPQRLRFFR